MNDQDKSNDDLLAEIKKLRKENSRINLLLDDAEKLKNVLNEKEQYISTLFDHSATPTWIEDFSEIKKRFDQLKEDGVKDFAEYFNNHPEAVGELASLVKVIDVNEASLKLLGVKDKESLVRDVPYYFREESLLVFKDELITLAEGNNKFVSTITVYPQSGEELILGISLSVPKIYLDTMEKVVFTFFDITPMRRSREKLKESEEKFKTIFEQSPIAIQIYDKNGKLFDLNTQTFKLFGISDKTSIMEFNFWEDPRLSEENAAELKKLNSVYIQSELDFELVKKNNAFPTTNTGVIYVDMYIKPLTKAGEVSGYLVQILDVTKNILDQKKIRESEDRFRRLAENAPDMIYRMSIPEGEYEYVSPAANNIFGYSEEDFYSRPILIRDAIHPDWKDYFEEQWNNLLIGKMPPTYEYQIIHKSGETRWLNQRNILVLDENNKPKFIEGIVTDITKRKQTEEELIISEDRLSKIVLAANDGTWDWNLITNEVYFDPRYYKMAGYEVDEFPYKLEEFTKRVHAADIDYVMGKAQKHIEGKSERFEVEFRFLKKDNNWLWILARGYIVERDEKGIPKRFVGTHTDISTRKKAEISLLESEEKLRLVWEKSTDGMRLTNEEGIAVYVNDAYCKLMEKPRAEIEGKLISEVYKDNKREQILKKHIPRFRSRTIPEFFERDIVLWNGKKITLELSNSFLDIPEQPTLVLSIFRNITERKEFEVKLQESEGMLKSILRAAPTGIGVIINRVIKFVNQNFTEMLGYSFDELINQNSRIVYETDEEFERVGKEKYEQIQKYGTGTIETQLQRKDGRIIDVLLSSTPINRKDLSHGVTFTALDITERKLAVRELKESQIFNETLLNTSPDNIYIYDIINQKNIYTNNGILDILGYSVEEIQAMGENFVAKIMHPDDLEIYFKNIIPCYKSAKDGDLIEHDYRMKHKDGNWRWLHSKEIIFKRLEDGTPEQIFGISSDITYRKKAEEELKLAFIDLEKSKLQLRELNIRSQNIREKERTNISREIHDTLGQALTALKMDIAWIQKKVKFDDDNLSDKFEQMKKLLDDTTSSVQKISTELRPGLLDDLGLTYALDWQCREFEKRTEIKSTLELEPEEIELSENISIELFRIVQEALTNIVRHAKATKVVVSLIKGNEIVELKITDNGIGINEKNIEDPKSLGLLGITERVYSINGEVNFLKRKQGGTEVKVIVPLENEDKDK